MDTPRKTHLYNEIAKDYNPKQAEMNICRYVEGLEKRIEDLEKATKAQVKPAKEPAKAQAKPAKEPTKAASEDVVNGITTVDEVK